MTIALRALESADLSLARELLAAACPATGAAEVAAEKLFGPAPDPGGAPLKSEVYGAFDPTGMAGLVVASAQWVRLLAVRPDARGQGIGTVLLAAAESAISATGATGARTLDQPGNYLAPGISADDPDTVGWLDRRGYRVVASNCNLLVDVAGNPRVTAARSAALDRALAAAGSRVRRAAAADRAHLSTAIAAAFSPAWAFEVDRALEHRPAGVHLALDAGGALAGFAAHDGNNQGLGWFGPAGTLPEHRRRGLGEALLLRCLLDVAAAGHARCTIAWIGPREFYQRSAGIVDEHHFVVLRKDLASP